MQVWDKEWKERIDGISGGVWTVNVGYGAEERVRKVRDRLVKLGNPASLGLLGHCSWLNLLPSFIEKMRGCRQFELLL